MWTFWWVPIITCAFLLALPFWKSVQTDFPDGLVPLGPFPSDLLFRFLSSVFLFRTENGIFFFSLFSFFVHIVLESARISSRTLSFRGPSITTSMFAIFDRFLHIAFRLSSWVSFPGCCPLKRPVFIAGIEIIVPSFFCSTERQTISFNREKLPASPLRTVSCRYKDMRGFNSSEKWSCFLYNFPIHLDRELCHGEKYFVPLGVEAFHPFTLELDS